jgi:glyoxylase-like metal-dependent hydrolase (beta-lactamase superfamily II)
METIAKGVHLVRGGFPPVMNVYLIEDAGGVTIFDAGIAAMGKKILNAAAKIGPIRRLVLGHSHTDHRGAAPRIAGTGVPVFCHEAELADAEADGGLHYFHFDQLPLRPGRFAMPYLLKLWDGGPVPIEGVVTEGDSVAGFDVVHFPGHAPGLIGLYRESDGLVLSSDTIYTIDPLSGIPGAPRIPLAGFNLDTKMAEASVLKLSALSPETVWAGHGKPLKEDTTAVLDHLGRHGGRCKKLP